MKQNEHTFNNSENTPIFYHEWLPDSDSIRALVFIVHGYGEHSGRYRHVAEALTAEGFACYGLDHRGHGKSEGSRVFFTDLQHVVDDLLQFFNMIIARYSGKPIFMYGHSMGSLIALQFTLQNQSRLKGLVVTGTAITGDELQPNWLISLAHTVAKITPQLRATPSLPVSTLSSDEEQVAIYVADPLVDKKMWKVGTASAMLRACKSIREQIPKLTLPLLVMHGADDELTPPSGSRYIEDHASSTDKTVKILDGMRHELVNEVERDAIIREIADWLIAHT